MRLRGTCGVTYDLNGCNTIGAFYQSRMDFQFPNAIRFNSGPYRDLRIDQPQTIGIGVANHSLMDGDLLLAADVYYKLWDDAAIWQDLFVNQWAFAVGAQLTRGQCKYRLGYSYNSSPINHSVGGNLDGYPVGQDIVQLFQAACVPCVNQHRITFGVGREGFLVPNLDLDIFAGFLPKQSSQFGTNTQASLAMYYIGMGLTWRFGTWRSACVQVDDGQVRHDAGCHAVEAPGHSRSVHRGPPSPRRVSGLRPCRRNSGGPAARNLI